MYLYERKPCQSGPLLHVDVKYHFLRQHARAGLIKLIKCAGPRNVADALTKSLPRPAFFSHRPYMWGTRTPFAAFYTRSLSSLSAAVAAGKLLGLPPVGTLISIARTTGG